MGQFIVTEHENRAQHVRKILLFHFRNISQN